MRSGAKSFFICDSAAEPGSAFCLLYSLLAGPHPRSLLLDGSKTRRSQQPQALAFQRPGTINDHRHRGLYSVIAGSNVHNASVMNTTSKNTRIDSHMRATGRLASGC